jgi:hypothetical protein
MSLSNRGVEVMNSLARTVIVVLVIFGVTAAVAQADTMYVNWRFSPAGVYAYDVATGNSDPGFSYISGTIQGIAISPLDGYLYAVSVSNKEIWRFNPVTGAKIDAAAWVTFGGTTRGLAFDSSGNLYAATGYTSNYGIAKIAPDKTVTNQWGNFGTNNYFACDIEVRDGKLYGGLENTTLSVASWDLATGGAATTVVTGAQCDGVTFGPDGTMYTSVNNGVTYRQVRKWDIPTNTSTVILSLPYTGNFIGDVDFWNGYLYANNNKDVYRCDLSDPITWSQHIVGSTTYTGGTGYMAFRIPEPGTLALLGISLLSLLCYAWKRK